MVHEWESCNCALCLTVRRVVGLLYAPDCSGAVQRRGVTLLREVYSQLLDVADTGAATSVPPVESGSVLPGEGDKTTSQKVKTELNNNQDQPKPEEGFAPVVDTAEESGSSPVVEKKAEEVVESALRETDLKDTEIEKENTETKDNSPVTGKKEKRSRRKESKSRDRRRRDRRDKEARASEGAERRSRSRQRRARRRSSRPTSPQQDGGGDHSPPKESGRERKEPKPRAKSQSRSPVLRAPWTPVPSRASGLTNAQKRAVPPPPKPPPVRPTPREPDHPPPGYSSWEATNVRAKSKGYGDPPPNKGKKKDERNANFRLWREYERGYW